MFCKIWTKQCKVCQYFMCLPLSAKNSWIIQFLFYLFSEILLYGYWGAAYVLCFPCYQSVHIHYYDYVGSPSVVTIINCFDDSIYPWFPMFTLHGNVNSMRKEWVFASIIWASSSLMIMGSLLICGNRPLMSLLNNSMAGLGKPVPMGVDVIKLELHCY